ncbi:DUF1349 domain-containing protein [Negadavirga shengliensis]|uniref:DUF1349 domain-containing protein n=1 Tax=Negadavirga shengliensis TaxID=1389218 RepID=A0ABV9TAD8_9BACT
MAGHKYEFFWHNPPQEWSFSHETLVLHADPKTDFWRKTHYGFVRDNGHFWYVNQKGDFEATVKLVAEYRDQYDQAGLMVRLDNENWVKAGVEYVNGVQHASVVVTREFSDWSVKSLETAPTAIWLKMRREHDFLEISYSIDAERFQMLRLAYFPPSVEMQVGIMAAAPEGNGFKALFEKFQLRNL